MPLLSPSLASWIRISAAKNPDQTIKNRRKNRKHPQEVAGFGLIVRWCFRSLLIFYQLTDSNKSLACFVTSLSAKKVSFSSIPLILLLKNVETEIQACHSEAEMN